MSSDQRARGRVGPTGSHGPLGAYSEGQRWLWDICLTCQSWVPCSPPAAAFSVTLHQLDPPHLRLNTRVAPTPSHPTPGSAVGAAQSPLRARGGLLETVFRVLSVVGEQPPLCPSPGDPGLCLRDPVPAASQGQLSSRLPQGVREDGPVPLWLGPPQH